VRHCRRQGDRWRVVNWDLQPLETQQPHLQIIGAGSKNYLPARLLTAAEANVCVYGLGDQVARERAEMSAPVFSIVSDWTDALLVFELGEDDLNRIRARCFVLFKTTHGIWRGLDSRPALAWRYEPDAFSRRM